MVFSQGFISPGAPERNASLFGLSSNKYSAWRASATGDATCSYSFIHFKNGLIKRSGIVTPTLTNASNSDSITPNQAFNNAKTSLGWLGSTGSSGLGEYADLNGCKINSGSMQFLSSTAPDALSKIYGSMQLVEFY